MENFAIKPAVSGIPPKLIKKSAKAVATPGDFFAKPAQRLRSFTSPVESLTKVTIPNAPMVANPYATK